MFLQIYNLYRMEMNSGSIAGYFLQALPVALLAGMVYALLRTGYIKSRRLPISWPTEVIGWLFACYLTGLCSLVILPANFWLSVYDGIFFGWWDQIGPIFQPGEINLVPTLVKYASGALTLGSWVKQMLIGNVVMLMPLGFFLPLLTKKFRGKTAFAAAIVVPVVMEALQFIFGRSFDIDDILCNFVGIVFGFFLACAMKKAGGRQMAE